MARQQIISFSDVAQAKHLAAIERAAPVTPLFSQGVQQGGILFQPPISQQKHTWWVEVKANVTIGAGSKSTPVGGIVWLLERTDTGLDYYLYLNQKIEEYVFNPYPRQFKSPDRFMVSSDMDGDLYIIGYENVRLKGVVTEQGGIDPTGSGEVTIYRNGTPTSYTVTAYVNWMNKNSAGVRQGVGEDAEVIVEYWEDENKWFIVAADCIPQ